MVIKALDGINDYQVTGSINTFDPSNPEIELYNEWDQLSIQIGGSPIYYYPVFISGQQIDKLYQESRAKVWSQHPIQLYCFYQPLPPTNDLGLFGIDGITPEMVFEFNYKALLDALGGQLPKLGSRLFTPHLRENWEIIQFSTGGYEYWNVLRLKMVCKRFQESLTTNEGQNTSSKVNYKIV